MQLLQKFNDFIKAENLFQPTDKLLVAVSGGIDSIVLCELCKLAAYDFEMAHCNFQLRGRESERDEDFVKTLGEKFGVKVHTKRFETENYATQKKLSIQVAARELRYNWFKELISVITQQTTIDQQPSKHILVATAHHANDNIETLLMNFFKGTGINGLHGIPAKQGHVVRPLLFATKEEIKNFASENNLPFAEDSSNASDKYTRNFFRNQLIPSIQKVFPKVEENLMDNLPRFNDIRVLYDQSIQFHKKHLLEIKGEEIHIPVLKLLKTIPLSTVVYEIIKDYNFTSSQTSHVIRLLGSDSGRFISSSSHKILRNRNWLIISPIDTTIAENILVEEKDKMIEYANGKLKFESIQPANCQLSSDSSISTLNADNITFPLLLRKWKRGDYFYPLGMQKKKKLSRFFIDEKMSLTEKENTWIIESNKKIIWIVGKRIDDRFKITPTAKKILKISQC